LSREDELQIRASALAARAQSLITAELGPRALPTHKDTYLATANGIAREVIGDDWDYRLTLDMEGKVHVFMEQYRG
jgi:hypothetical protein